ncbi:MAG: hypothetical protein LBH85_00315 [Treponema sp.]|jgi:hypothetical protein|nr:hypothetical protein [Treponema sp.]
MKKPDIMKHKAALVVALALVFASCSGQITGVLREDGSADIAIQSGLPPSVATLISVASGGAGSILDAQTIALSIRNARGVKSASMRNITPSSIDGSVSVSQANDFFALPGAYGGRTQRLITYEQTTGGGGRLSIALNRATAPQFVSLLSPDAEDYLSCLMAPGLTTDWQYIQTKAEYIRQLRATYNTLRNNRGLGNTLASELESATITLALDFPGVIRSVRGGTFSSKRAEFAVPVIDLLTLEKPLAYEVVWE